MADENAALLKIRKIVEDYWKEQKYEFVPGKTKIPLNAPSFGPDEICEAIDSLLKTYVTMGPKVKAFEQAYASYLGSKYGTMVNSGSTANLMALSVLSNPLVKDRIKRDDEVIVPAVTWSTSVFPIGNIGAMPVLVDIDMHNFGLNVQAVEDAITEKTRAIMAVHLLGNPCDIFALKKVADEHGLFLIEDTCESTGAKIGGKFMGSVGDMGSFSFFFSHHITTMEGGMVVTDNEEYDEMLKPLRAHGWTREMRNRDAITAKHADIDSRFLFVNTGYNVRPTDLQGAFGIHQIKKLDGFIKIRQENAVYWAKRLSGFRDVLEYQTERPNTRHVWFGFPITVKPGAPFTRKELTNWLESKCIETRPVMGGNLAEQPAFKFIEHKVSGDLKNAKHVMRDSFFFGNHQNVGPAEREWVAKCITDFVSARVKK